MAVSSATELKFPWGLQTCFQVYGTKRKFHHSGVEPLDINQSLAKRPCFVPSPLQTDTEANYPHSKIELPIHNHQTASLLNGRIPCQRSASPYEDDDMPTCKRPRPLLLPESPVDNETEMSVTIETPESRNWQHSKECNDLQPRFTGNDSEQADLLESKRLHEQTVAAHAEKLQSQLNFLQEIQAQSNDYWAVPQENQLKMADELEQARNAMDTDYVPDRHQYGYMPASAAVPMAGPNAHSTAGQIRCYCKPSWEGMLEPMSYI